MGSEDLDIGGGVPGIPSRLNGSILERHWAGRRRENALPEEDRGNSRTMQQSHLVLELHPRMGKGVRFGSVVRYWGRQAGGGTTGSPRNQQDPLVWSVADETQPCPNPPSAIRHSWVTRKAF